MRKILVVTCNAIDGLPYGRYQKGKVVVFTCDSGRNNPRLGDSTTPRHRAFSERKFRQLRRKMADDIKNIGEAFVYVGQSARNGCENLIRYLVARGKKVHMVACTCGENEKRSFAKDLGIRFMWCECGGEVTCAGLVRRLSKTR